MDVNKMMWSVLLHMEMSFSPQCKRSGEADKWVFDEKVWNEIIDECINCGVNTVVLEVGRGVEFGSHPEIAQPWAWSRQRMKKEVKRCKNLGIELIPKLNFSATHDGWLMEYERLMSTPTYYRVCRDLILEAGEIFDNPRFIHLGMDEEDAAHAGCTELAVYRHKDLLWHDLQYLFDCVREAGSTPWIWFDPCFNFPEDFYEKIGTDDVVITPWMYNAIRKDHFTPIASRQVYIDYYAKEPYKSLNIQYVEEEPYIIKFNKEAVPCVNKGYTIVPCVSSINQCKYNAVDMLECFKDNCDPKKVIGFMTAPWYATIENHKQKIINDIRWFRQGIDEIYYGKEIGEKDRVNIEYDKIGAVNIY